MSACRAPVRAGRRCWPVAGADCCHRALLASSSAGQPRARGIRQASVPAVPWPTLSQRRTATDRVSLGGNHREETDAWALDHRGTWPRHWPCRNPGTRAGAGDRHRPIAGGARSARRDRVLHHDGPQHDLRRPDRDRVRTCARCRRWRNPGASRPTALPTRSACAPDAKFHDGRALTPCRCHRLGRAGARSEDRLAVRVALRHGRSGRAGRRPRRAFRAGRAVGVVPGAACQPGDRARRRRRPGEAAGRHRSVPLQGMAAEHLHRARPQSAILAARTVHCWLGCASRSCRRRPRGASA